MTTADRKRFLVFVVIAVAAAVFAVAFLRQQGEAPPVVPQQPGGFQVPPAGETASFVGFVRSTEITGDGFSWFRVEKRDGGGYVVFRTYEETGIRPGNEEPRIFVPGDVIVGDEIEVFAHSDGNALYAVTVDRYRTAQ